jgi:L-aspartate oxidase
VLYHPSIRSFLISEALRGEGAVLKCREHSGAEPQEFMHKYHPMKSLAPRDVVARAIDSEMKRTGEECVYLDIRHLSEETLRLRFPNIFNKCLEAGVNMAHDLIPVVPAAHFVCGGIKTDVRGRSSIEGLYAVGEAGCTGLHGANRLASNSLLEAMVVGGFAAQDINENFEHLQAAIPEEVAQLNWTTGNATDSDERILIAHNWDEIRRFMWDYVGIYRTNKRLERAKARIVLIRKEIEKYYWDFLVTPDLIELRNIAAVAELIIDCSLARRESRGLHYNSDYPETDPALAEVDTIVCRKL